MQARYVNINKRNVKGMDIEHTHTYVINPVPMLQFVLDASFNDTGAQL